MYVDRPLRVLAFAGSLRAGSFNKALLRAARRVAPDDIEIEITDLAGIPLYDADLEQQGDPRSVTEFKERIERGDGLLIATPEYQHSISGVLKNALDWASRPPDGAPITGKPVAILGATTGGFGTARAQDHLRTVLAYNACPTVKRPEVLVSRVRQKVDEEGEITDETTLEFVEELLVSLRKLTSRFLREPA